MPSVPFFKFRFTPSWIMLFLFMIFFSFFVRLGFWQLQRADEKKQMLAAQQYQAQQVAKSWNKTQKLPAQYERIRLEGHYLPQVFLLDNQHHQHQFGYDVISPLQLADGAVVLIDRGWVAGDVMRKKFPEVLVPQELVNLSGYAYFPSKNQWVLGPEFEKKSQNLTIVERLDVNLLHDVLQKAVYPFIIRLDKQDSHGFVRKWEIIAMPAERHLAYALQWFVIAFVILIIFVALNLKKRNEENVL